MSRLSWPSRGRPEEGLTLIEVLVALGIMFSALMVLAFTMLSGLSAVGFSRQRTEATALANQALEQIRGLPASQLFMNSPDVAGDVQLVACATGTCFNSRTVPVANFGPSPSTSPFTPNHLTTVTAVPDKTVYTIKSYITCDPTCVPTDDHVRVVTVQVSWSASQKTNIANHVQVETKIFNNQFNPAPPTVHTFLLSAQGVPGVISVTGSVLGKALANTTFNLPSTSAGMSGTSLPSSTNVGAAGNAVAAGINQSGINAGGIQILNTPAVSTSAQSLAGGATQGPVTPPASNPTVLGVIPGTFGLVDTASLTGTAAVGASESVSAVAASAAGGTPNTPGSPSPSLPANGLGYGQGSATQSGAVAANLSVLGILGTPLASIGLVNFVPSGNGKPDLSTVAQNGSSGHPELQTFNASASQSFTELDIVNLSLLGAPLPPLIKLTGFNKTASACTAPTGVACTAPAPVDTGSISILGNPDISIQNLLNGIVPVSTLNSLLNNPINLGVVALGVTGAISLGTTPTGAANSTSQKVTSPLAITLTVNGSLLGLPLLNINITVNLGTVQATASYS